MKKRTLFFFSCFVIISGLLLTYTGYRSNAELIRQARVLTAFYRGQVNQPQYVTIIDYSRSILAQRLAVVNTRGVGKVVLRSRVSHAWNSGVLYASRFSNVNGSECSCRGVFLTQEIFVGRFGTSLRLRGLNPVENGNARERAIIFHPGLTYSAGCFMTAADVNQRLISLIKNGSLVAVIQ